MKDEKKCYSYFAAVCRTMYYNDVKYEEDVKLVCGAMTAMMILDECDNDDIADVFFKVLSNWESILEGLKELDD